MSKGAQLPELRVWFGKKIRNVRWGRLVVGSALEALNPKKDRTKGAIEEDPELLRMTQPSLRSNNIGDEDDEDNSQTTTSSRGSSGSTAASVSSTSDNRAKIGDKISAP